MAVVNAIGSQLSDDRALLPFAGQIIGFYLGERALLPTLPTYWLGDIDQREMVIADIEKYTIRPLFGEKILLGGNGRQPTEEEITARKKQCCATAVNMLRSRRIVML